MKKVYEKPVCKVILVKEKPLMMNVSIDDTMDNLVDEGEVPVDEYDK